MKLRTMSVKILENMIAAKLMDYKGTIRCVMQNEIMAILLNAKRLFMNVI